MLIDQCVTEEKSLWIKKEEEVTVLTETLKKKVRNSLILPPHYSPKKIKNQVSLMLETSISKWNVRKLKI